MRRTFPSTPSARSLFLFFSRPPFATFLTKEEMVAPLDRQSSPVPLTWWMTLTQGPFLLAFFPSRWRLPLLSFPTAPTLQISLSHEPAKVVSLWVYYPRRFPLFFMSFWVFPGGPNLTEGGSRGILFASSLVAFLQPFSLPTAASSPSREPPSFRPPCKNHTSPNPVLSPKRGLFLPFLLHLIVVPTH